MLAWTIPPEAYLYLRRLHEKLSSPDKGQCLNETATHERPESGSSIHYPISYQVNH